MMMSKPAIDPAYIPHDQLEPVVAETKSCACCGSTFSRTKGLGLADKKDQPANENDPRKVDYDQIREDKIVELAIQLLESTTVLQDLPASMRLIEHIAECAGYRRAQQSASPRVTELMLMAARASALADDFRQDL